MDPGALLVILILVGYATCYLLMCAAFPFGNCRACEGTGKHHSPLSRKVFRLCSRCAGTGRRVRLGRRIFEYLRGEHQRGHGIDQNRPGR